MDECLDLFSPPHSLHILLYPIIQVVAQQKKLWQSTVKVDSLMFCEKTLCPAGP